ncbi:MAG: 7-cyano-7-deazaguanine synthase QueC [PVC group bacterium]|nr:7-cyano-7-deazaguanine synthase QueC [PVC group bacterium]
MKKRAVVLLSGGLDSATTLYFARKKGYEIFCLCFDYGQRHKKEIKLAQKLACVSGSKWQMVKFSMPWTSSSLLDKKRLVPKDRDFNGEIPSTYVPARNIVFLSFAASFAEAVGARVVFIGANQIDYSGYPDCRDDFLKAFEQALRKGTKSGVEGRKKISIIAPLVNKNKAQIIKMAKKLGVPLELTWSCYNGGKSPCGVCDSCRLRSHGFEKAKSKDPVQ